MEDHNIKSSIDFKDKGATYWKWLVLEQVRLAAYYLQAMDHIDRLEDLERHECDHNNLVNMIANPKVRRFYGLFFLVKTWHDQDVCRIAIKMIEELAEDIDAMSVTQEAFLRMATVRINEDSSLLENLESTFFQNALEYAFGRSLDLYSFTLRSESFVKLLAKNLEANSRDDWSGNAKFSLEMMKSQARQTEPATG